MMALRYGSTIAVLVLLSGCAVPDWKIDGRITRYFKIKNNRFDPAEIHVPANTPFTLAIDAYSDQSRVFIVSKDLGIPAQNIRAYVQSRRWLLDTNVPVRTSIPIRSLPVGRYSISTVRYGVTTNGMVDVTAETQTR